MPYVILLQEHRPKAKAEPYSNQQFSFYILCQVLLLKQT